MNNKDKINHKVFWYIILAMSVLFTGCKAKQIPDQIQNPVFNQTSSPTATLALPTNTLPAPEMTFKVMAYNILFGAGVEPDHAEQPGNHLNDLIALVKEADPDFLGLEEVSGWEAGNPSVIEQFASAVKMEYYYLAPNLTTLNNAIFSKYPILETQNLSDIVSIGALRAKVQLPDGSTLNLVVVHLNPENSYLRSCEFDRLRSLMESYRYEPGILMGDWNASYSSSEARYLTQAGWELVTGASIDSIMIRSANAWSSEHICFQRGLSRNGCIGDSGISDHLPVGAVISFYDVPNAAYQELTATPARPYGCFSQDEIGLFADPILAAIANRAPDYQDDFSDPSSGWAIQTTNGESGYVSGEYFLRTDDSQNAYISSNSSYAVPSYTDMAFDLESSFETGQISGHFQILFRRNFSNGNWADVYVSIFSDGRIDLGWQPGETLVTKRISPASSYHTQIIMLNNEIAVYVNDEPLIYYDTSNLAPSPAANTIRFIAATHDEKSLEVRMDNLKIWDISNLASP